MAYGQYYEEAGENIRDLIPEAQARTKKEKRHRSKHNGIMPPSYSTFGAKNGSQLGVTNVGGDTHEPSTSHMWKKGHSTMGMSHQRSQKPQPRNFLTKKDQTLAPPNKFSRTQATGSKKASVPKRGEKPVYGLVTSKNFITANAVANILAEPKKRGPELSGPQTHAEFGKVPEYLTDVKREVQEEYDYIMNMQRAQVEAHQPPQPEVTVLPEEERLEMVYQLKMKWQEINEKYQTITHITTLDAIGLVRKKETYETELQQLEKDIQRLSKKTVFVRSDPVY